MAWSAKGPAASRRQPTAHLRPPTPPNLTPLGIDCPTDPEPITDPVRIELVGHGLDMPIIQVGRDAEGAPASPPPDAGYTIAWWQEGPLVGSSQGKVVLTSHTFQFGGALGNDLNNGLLAAGDVIRISDAQDNAVCYRYAGSHHVLVADYDPGSDILYDWDGDPQFAMVVCSDYLPSGEALGRIIHYADLVTGPLTLDQG